MLDLVHYLLYWGVSADFLYSAVGRFVKRRLSNWIELNWMNNKNRIASEVDGIVEHDINSPQNLGRPG